MAAAALPLLSPAFSLLLIVVVLLALIIDLPSAASPRAGHVQSSPLLPECDPGIDTDLVSFLSGRGGAGLKFDSSSQGSYRNVTAVFHDFPGQNYFIFQTFQGILYLFI